MGTPYVYDKAKYHAETVEDYGLPEEHAANHTVFFLRWLIEQDLMSTEFVEESAGILAKVRAGRAGIHEVYEWWDCCLIDDMLADEGNAFARHYFDFDDGAYLRDYAETLQRDLTSEFHVEYSEENYRLIKSVIDRRFGRWKAREGR